jgi:hypothetical protein
MLMTQEISEAVSAGLIGLGLISLGMRIGTTIAARRIVDGFVRHPELSCDRQELGLIGQVLRRRNWNELGRTLASMALSRISPKL